MDLVRHMITRYGMSEALGLETFEAPRQALFLHMPTGAPREYSNETARIINAENGCVARGTLPLGVQRKSRCHILTPSSSICWICNCPS